MRLHHYGWTERDKECHRQLPRRQESSKSTYHPSMTLKALERSVRLLMEGFLICAEMIKACGFSPHLFRFLDFVNAGPA